MHVSKKSINSIPVVYFIWQSFVLKNNAEKKIDKVYYNRIKVGYLLTNMWHLLHDHPVRLLIKTNQQEKLPINHSFAGNITDQYHLFSFYLTPQ